MIDRYTCPDIDVIWSLRNKYQLWTYIELELLRGLHPDSEVPPKVEVTENDIPVILEIESRTHHDVAAFVQWLEKQLEHRSYPHSNKVHYGLTSSDIVDTTLSLQLFRTTAEILKRAFQVEIHLRRMIKTFKAGEIPPSVVGRTHGQAAEIIRFWQRLESWRSTLQWAMGEIQGIRFYGKLSGSVGDNKYLATSLTNHVIEHLGLLPSPITQGQVISRAYHASILNKWAVLAAVVEKIATDIRLLSQTGIEELAEGFSEEQIGSSSMPHKRNPIGCENLCGLARMVRGHASTAMQNVALWCERDISHSSVERIIFPDAGNLMGYMLDRLLSILTNLSLNWYTMEKNIENAPGLDSQRKMLEKINAGSSRTDAHEDSRPG